jgi:S1-C subfamily serine protease
MQRLPGIGTRIIRIAPGSAGARAGLQIGDVITLAADALAPTPAVIRARAADTASPGPLLLGVTRGDSHRLITLDR